MVMPRGSESWRRMSRFRRQSLVKPLAAEVLEPRCLMTEALGAGLTTPPLAADAAPLTGDVVIGPDLWDDAGLTLQQIGDLLHVFRNDTRTDVITPMLASEITSLNFIGRDNAANVLTIHLPLGLSLGIDRLGFEPGLGYSPCSVRLERRMGASFLYIHFAQGSGVIGLPSSFCDSGASEVAPINNDSNQEAVVNDLNGTEAAVGVSRDDDSEWESVGDVLLTGQGIATVGIEDRELAEFDAASSDSAFGELADSEPEDDEGPTAETLADSDDLAANSDTNAADVGEELELDAALSNDLLVSLAERQESGE